MHACALESPTKALAGCRLHPVRELAAAPTGDSGVRLPGVWGRRPGGGGGSLSLGSGELIGYWILAHARRNRPSGFDPLSSRVQPLPKWTRSVTIIGRGGELAVVFLDRGQATCARMWILAVGTASHQCVPFTTYGQVVP